MAPMRSVCPCARWMRAQRLGALGFDSVAARIVARFPSAGAAPARIARWVREVSERERLMLLQAVILQTVDS